MTDARPNHIPGPNGLPPAELRELKGWLLWQFEQHPAETKARKVPYYVTGQRRYGKQGAPEDRAKMTTFAAARNAAARLGFDGVGLALLPEFGVVALDLDHCIEVGGDTPGQLLAIIGLSYAEISPSGTGIRAFFRGDLGNHKSPRNAEHTYGAEVFSSSGFVTVTGKHGGMTTMLDLQDTIAPVSEALVDFCNSRFGPNRPQSVANDDFMAGHEPPVGLTDQQITEYLSDLDASMGRDDWITVGMAIHHETGGGGFALWDDWSAGGHQYPGTTAVQSQWDSFDRRRPGEANVTMATVIMMAKVARADREQATEDMNEGDASADGPEPMDPWRRHDPPALPVGVLPDVIERFARIQAEQMGADAGGLAQCALTVCAAAIPDSIQLQVKRHDSSWKQSARLWTAVVGLPSAKKSPILKAAMRPLRSIDAEMRRRHKAEFATYERLPPDERKSEPKPVLRQHVVEDTTVEALAVVASENEEGVLCCRDELSAWFGSMEKYSGAKGQAADRGVYLQAYDGGPYGINRISRGAIFVDNLSVNLLGGIQPDAIRRVTKDAPDDGLVQRLTPIVLGPSAVGKDEPAPDVASEYDALVRRLIGLTFSPFNPEPLTFDDGAQEVRRRLEVRHHELGCTETISRKLASHLGKYDGMFARLCVVFHCIENAKAGGLPAVITTDTAERVAAFLHDFLLPHAIAFYTSVLGLTDHDDLVVDVAGYILAHKTTVLTHRNFKRGSTAMKPLNWEQIRRLMETLEALGWGESASNGKPNASPKLLVNQRVHAVFAEKASAEKARRAEISKTIAGVVEGGV